MKFANYEVEYRSKKYMYTIQVESVETGEHKLVKQVYVPNDNPFVRVLVRDPTDKFNANLALHEFPGFDLAPIHYNRTKMNACVSALVNYATSRMVTFIDDVTDLDTFIEEWALDVESISSACSEYDELPF